MHFQSITEYCFPSRPHSYILRKYAREISISPPKGILGLGWGWGGGGGSVCDGETYFYTNFYETHSVLHFNRK